MPSDDNNNNKQRRSVLDPDELDISRREEVAEIDDGRYVVSPDGSKPRVDPESIERQDWLQRDRDDEASPASRSARSEAPGHDPPSGPSAGSSPARSTDAPEISAQDVSRWLARSFARNRGQYGFDLTVDMEGNVKRTRAASNDIGEALESMLRWYADQATDDLPPERVVGILLAATDMEVQYPVQSVYTLVKRHGLTPEDSIGDLLQAVRTEGYMAFPPSKTD